MGKKPASSRKQKWIRIIILFILIGFIASATSFLAIRSEWNATIEDPDSVDVLIVLGAGVWGDKPSPQLKLRLETAADVSRDNPDIKIIVSGGQGPDEDISEAQAMKVYLTQLGVDKESILMEDQSTSTVENLRFSKEMLDSLGLDNPAIGIVTTDFHMYRAKMLARRFGMKPQGQAAPNVPIIIVQNTVREIAALIKDTLIH